MPTLAKVLREGGYIQDGKIVRQPSATAQKMNEYVKNIIPNALQNAANQRADIDAALTMGQGGIQIGDRAAFERQMAEVPNLMGLTAYHGTPHTIKGKFDISKVGTGEGAQAYGHGMYFAENPAVAKEYQKRLSADSALNYQARGLDSAYISAANSFKEYGSNYDETLKGLKEAYKNASEKDLELAAKVAFQPTGNLYKVDIPDEYIPNMLDWDKPFKEQTAFVQQAIKQIEPKLKKIAPDINVQNLTGKQIYQAYQQFRGNQPDFASEGLNELGIKGIRYLDQQSRTPGFSSLTPTQLQARIESLQSDIKAGGGNTKKMQEQLQGLQNELDSYKNMTSNFVVFEPNEVKILEQNSKPLTRKEIIEQELEKVAK